MSPTHSFWPLTAEEPPDHEDDHVRADPRHRRAAARPDCPVVNPDAPKGDAAVAMSRIKAQIEALDAEDRADLIVMLAQLVREFRRAERATTAA